MRSRSARWLRTRDAPRGLENLLVGGRASRAARPGRAGERPVAEGDLRQQRVLVVELGETAEAAPKVGVRSRPKRRSQLVEGVEEGARFERQQVVDALGRAVTAIARGQL